MITVADRRRRGAGQGFTLVELLLTTVLVLLLLGAIVFNFSTLQRGVELEEGAAQLEGLLRFARAEAANTGRKVQVSFEPDGADDLSLAGGKIRVVWEPDPLDQPGHFEELTAAAEYVAEVANLVQVEAVRPLEPDGAAPAFASTNAVPEPLADEEDLLDYLPPITFHPDGSSDSMEIILTSRSENDPRRMAVRVVGITGTIRHQLVVEEENAEPESQTEPEEQKNPRSEITRTSEKPTSTNVPSFK